ncbi:DUF6768 family protein [Aquimarina litoralis]|uniref:DUF6768 family protein n=1 Tax=Aquimarina litoralis TaxID=584605 RepID=UPI001C582257|nr:DUF6768 family protein [Aquimarina litoralis]MBW1296797.1 hypothetical protein [Aquimarina litoralis]
MNTNMEEIDKLIKETLTKEEAKFYDELDEQTMFEMIGGMYKTKNRWIIIMMNIVNVIAFGLFIYCVVKFLGAESTNDLIKWSAAGFLCIMMTSMLKIFSWLQIDKNALIREIKRLELQVSSLASKL